MGSTRRAPYNQYLIYLALNVVVSVITVLLVLNVWDRRKETLQVTPTATVDVIAHVASAIPTASPTIPPSPTPVTYKVRLGDTLFAIALEFDVTVEALMAANGLTDPNTLDTGQVLVIPDLESPAFSQPTPILVANTPQPTVTPNPDAQAPRVVITGVEGTGVLEEEYVRLLNSGGEVSMAGWTIDDGRGREYTFPAFTFYSTGAVHVHTQAGEDTTIHLFWGLDEPVWTPGKMITLRDASGLVQSTFQLPGN